VGKISTSSEGLGGWLLGKSGETHTSDGQGLLSHVVNGVACLAVRHPPIGMRRRSSVSWEYEAPAQKFKKDSVLPTPGEKQTERQETRHQFIRTVPLDAVGSFVSYTVRNFEHLPRAESKLSRDPNSRDCRHLQSNSRVHSP
jgi:hypothetical protein